MQNAQTFGRKTFTRKKVIEKLSKFRHYFLCSISAIFVTEKKSTGKNRQFNCFLVMIRLGTIVNIFKPCAVTYQAPQAFTCSDKMEEVGKNCTTYTAWFI